MQKETEEQLAINEIEEIHTIPFIQRDRSWLSFNHRVLQEAKDPIVPLMEKIKFLAIYSSNLDEFFRVRVAQHRSLIRLSKKTKKELDYNPKKTLKSLLRIVNEQQMEFSRIFMEEIIPGLREHNIFLMRRLDLSKEQNAFVESYFQENLLPFVQPVILVKDKIRFFLNNAALYLAVALVSKDSYTSKTEYAIVKIPSDFLPRFIELPSKSGRHEVMMLDDIVRHSVAWLFPGYDIIDTYSIKLTRDAELYIDDEFTGNLIQKVKSSLQKRNVGPASRFVYDRTIPQQFLDFLSNTFDLEKTDMLPEGRYHNNFDFFKFPDFGLSQLKYKSLPPQKYPALEDAEDFFNVFSERDHLLHFPYQSYESVIRFFEAAAEDPSVSHIKIVQYRVAKKSRIMRALMKAVENGKQVSVFIEVKARFDEEANIKWGEALQKAGVAVYYSMPGIKVHSKLALVSRKEGRKEKLYAYLGTGNFNEDTAKVYSDLCIFTTDERLTKEIARVFRYLETANKEGIQPFKHLLVGQFNLREGLVAKIDREIAFAKAGKPASMILKMNSLSDTDMITKLYEASQAGVKIKIITRGICSLVPNVKGFSENIEIISIVDRFLEHARVFIFNNGGKEEIYLSSADWMTRNLSHRVETSFPIYDAKLRQIIRQVIDYQLNDNVKARILNEEQDNSYRKDESEIAVRAQIETYYYFMRLNSATLPPQ
ncbi:MAG: polyphosphate kinase 1 [Saprospiraceae bacterium]|nr:polyphosphate kinase 1 [Saprospiraceae bacterium]